MEFQPHQRLFVVRFFLGQFDLGGLQLFLHAGNVGGIRTQIVDGKTGWLVDSSEACAAACLEIIGDPEEGRRRALAGKEYVRTHFLTPRLLRDWLVLFNRLLGNDVGEHELVSVPPS